MRIIAFVITFAPVCSAADSGAAPATAISASGSQLLIQEDGMVQLLSVKRVFVDRLTGGETAAQMRDLIITSLQGCGLFVITETQERADAILRGAAEDLVFTDVHSSSEGINARANISAGRGARTQRSNYESGGIGVGENESSRVQERKHEAMATVRLVNKDGEVIWSTTQESMGGKFRGSSADVADKIAKRLAEDYDRARKQKR